MLTALDNGTLAAMDLHGNDFGNEIWGTNGANFLSGGGGNDALIGFGGNDLLIGGGGNDYLDGGAGADTFAFITALGAGNVDTIADFSGTDEDRARRCRVRRHRALARSPPVRSSAGPRARRRRPHHLQQPPPASSSSMPTAVASAPRSSSRLSRAHLCWARATSR